MADSIAAFTLPISQSSFWCLELMSAIRWPKFEVTCSDLSPVLFLHFLALYEAKDENTLCAAITHHYVNKNDTFEKCLFFPSLTETVNFKYLFLFVEHYSVIIQLSERSPESEYRYPKSQSVYARVLLVKLLSAMCLKVSYDLTREELMQVEKFLAIE
ncbi:Uncharacterized protein Fot_00841 [Forsythia ovata]|uniref:Uncharacterized protein n=1 Tax=Forsythia ovata TaxID=205694 RepID=A0ABD1X2A2_9LAMI